MRPSRRRLMLVAAVGVTGAALAAVAVTRVHDSAPKRPPAPAVSQKVGDSADMMRRLQRKSLVHRDR
jgi:hypothetical protein